MFEVRINMGEHVGEPVSDLSRCSSKVVVKVAEHGQLSCVVLIRCEGVVYRAVSVMT